MDFCLLRISCVQTTELLTVYSKDRRVRIRVPHERMKVAMRPLRNWDAITFFVEAEKGTLKLCDATDVLLESISKR